MPRIVHQEEGQAPAGPRRGRPPKTPGVGSAETSGVILEAALDLFAERNFSSVTIKDIAAHADLNTALIYYYFGSKEELFRRSVTMAVDQAFSQFEARRDGVASPQDVIFEWLETHINAYSSIRKLIKIAIDYANAGSRETSVDEAIQRFYSGEYEILRQALNRGKRKGLFRAVDSRETAQFISTYLDGVIVRSIILETFDYPAAIQDFKRLLGRLLRREKSRG